MPKEAAMSNSKLQAAVAKFAQKYATAGSGVVSVAMVANGIKVVVKSEAAAGNLPTQFEGFAVTVYQHGGAAGDKLILRDDDGTVYGSEG
jgi:hypothetical protein